MVTREIPHEEWAEFLDDLGNQDEAVLVTVEVIGDNMIGHVLASGLRLQGLTLVEKGSGAGEIEIMLGERPEDHFSHVIATPSRLLVVETDEGEISALQVEAEDEPMTLVHFPASEALLDDEEEEEEIE